MHGFDLNYLESSIHRYSAFFVHYRKSYLLSTNPYRIIWLFFNYSMYLMEGTLDLSEPIDDEEAPNTL